ncbi:MAG: polyphosphate kinase 1 [Thermomicrobiales bacterium]|nr:polyphosphate kinase 1 [Thermomicrobiales bacterium]
MVSRNKRKAKKQVKSAQPDIVVAPPADPIPATSGARPERDLPPLLPELFINRELSWLDFNARVLTVAQQSSVPLLERVRFLSIVASNLDEFLMIRVAGVKRKIVAGITDPGADGRTPLQQYTAIHDGIQHQINEQARTFASLLVPRLRRRGIRVTEVAALDPDTQQVMAEYFMREVFPVLTPQAIDRARRFPHISNDSLNLLVELQSKDGSRYARIKIPAVLPRLIRVDHPEDHGDRTVTFVWLEDLVAANLGALFPGNEAVASYPFHVTRDADIEIDEDDEEAHDLLSIMREMLSERTFGSVVRLVVSDTMNLDVRNWLLHQLGASDRELYVQPGPLALEGVRELHRLDRPDLKDAPFSPAKLLRGDAAPPADPDETTAWGSRDIFATIRERDILIHHPYQSFNIVTDFVTAASRDADVVAIKQTLYRIGQESPLIPSLIEARDDDTQVAVLLELKARFDEENNITWAQELEHHGVHVTYGLAGLKTHCKVTLVVRREEDGLRSYVHLSTGNYNATTAKVYEDIGFFTSRPEITHDVVELFNVLTGYSDQEDFRSLWVAPHSLRERFHEAIAREIEAHKKVGGGWLFFKMNSLVDKELIRALYAASQAGVKVDLVVRGACCLRPGVPGWSENIRVRSLIGQFLEHSRLYHFAHGGEAEFLLGSADLMERNLDRRVEVVFPIGDPAIRDHLRTEVLPRYLADNVNSWTLGRDACWTRVETGGKGKLRRDIHRELAKLYAKCSVFGDAP